MALMITDDCINCDVCEDACPNQAISQGPEFYLIDPLQGTGCVGHCDEPPAQIACPVECSPLDPNWIETEEQLRAKLR